MALPLNSTPIYQLTVPSTDKVVKFRPFLVKEEKALLLAQQSEDPNVMIDTLQEVIKSCVKDEIDVGKLAVFDLEYIFTQIRAKSVGEEVELVFRCQHCDDDKARVNVKIDITQIDVQKTEDHTKQIPLFDDVGIVMKYPSLNMVKKLESLGNSMQDIFNIVIDCIDYIYNGDELIYASETSKEELEEFLNNMTTDQFANIQKFFSTMPVMKKQVDYDCPVCGAHNQAELSGISSFF